jgi:hypothetical protein
MLISSTRLHRPHLIDQFSVCPDSAVALTSAPCRRFSPVGRKTQARIDRTFGYFFCNTRELGRILVRLTLTSKGNYRESYSRFQCCCNHCHSPRHIRGLVLRAAVVHAADSAVRELACEGLEVHRCSECTITIASPRPWWVIIALQGGTMKIEDQSGTSETHVWETGKAYWLPANPPNTMHRDINVGDRSIEVIVVEVQDDK